MSAEVPTESAEFSFTLPPELLDVLADRLAPRVAALLSETAGDDWMDSNRAADYLGMTKNALHKLTSARDGIPFEQDGPGCKLHFRRSDLDRWRQGGRLRK